MNIAMALQNLKSTQCVCGAKKVPMQSLCRACFYSLPKGAQNALYRKVGQGYEKAYESACLILQDIGRVKTEVTSE